MLDSPKTIYSVPRKVDLATLLVITVFYACLFALMNLLRVDFWSFLAIGGFFSFIGISQAILLKGKSPRAASMVAGAIYLAAIFLFSGAGFNKSLYPTFRIALFLGTSIQGVLLGYLGGSCVGGIFLIIDYVRTGLARFRGARPAETVKFDDL
ncbi:MAG: hypothetical protein NTU79_24640 [Planctomycetota bacterium]|nr:hypothetical protein [Planctomycetota bacterium]